MLFIPSGYLNFWYHSAWRPTFVWDFLYFRSAGTCFHNFLVSESFFICLHSWQIYSLDKEFWFHSCLFTPLFPSRPSSLLFNCPVSSIVSYENLTLILVSLYVMCRFFLFFKFFFFIFGFQQFDYVYLELIFFALIPFGIFWASSIYTSMSFTQIRRFSAFFPLHYSLSFHLLKL